MVVHQSRRLSLHNFSVCVSLSVWRVCVCVSRACVIVCLCESACVSVHCVWQCVNVSESVWCVTCVQCALCVTVCVCDSVHVSVYVIAWQCVCHCVTVCMSVHVWQCVCVSVVPFNVHEWLLWKCATCREPCAYVVTDQFSSEPDPGDVDHSHQRGLAYWRSAMSIGAPKEYSPLYVARKSRIDYLLIIIL